MLQSRPTRPLPKPLAAISLLAIAALLAVNGCTTESTVLRVLNFFIMLYLLAYSFERIDDNNDGPHTPLFG